MNFGFIAAVKTKFGLIKEKKINPKEKEFYRINILKFLICLGCLFLSSIWLKKVYEVPVYVTDINIWDEGWSAENSNNTHLTVKIERNYGRSNNFKNSKKEIISDSTTDRQKLLYGISVYGQYYRNPDSLIIIHNRKHSKLKDSIQSFIDRYIPNYNSEEYFDSLYKTVYVSISGTTRQSAYLYRNLYHTEPVNQTKPGEYYQQDLGDMLVIGGCYKLSEMDIQQYSFKNHNVFLSSNLDSACYVYSYLNSSDFDQPKILQTMEDVSKIVEKLRFNTYFDKDSIPAPVDSIIFEYNGYMEISEAIYPKPDSISLSSLIYWDKNKIDYILNNDLVFHVHFPDMENIQEAKIFILSMLVTMFFGMLGNITYRIGIYKIWKNKILSYIITLLSILIIAVCIYTILFHAHANASDVQKKIESTYLQPKTAK